MERPAHGCESRAPSRAIRESGPPTCPKCNQVMGIKSESLFGPAPRGPESELHRDMPATNWADSQMHTKSHFRQTPAG